MTDLLVVLNPREIPECVRAIDGLDVPTCWVQYMPEPDAARAINAVVRAVGVDFDRFVLLADDTVPTRAAWDAILAAHDTYGDVMTGWCNLDSVSPFANLASNVLPPPPPEQESYDLIAAADVREGPAVIRTTFAGLCLTVVPREILLAHPLEVSAYGGQIDYMLSYRLAAAGVPLWAARDAFVWHVKERWCFPDAAERKRLLVGERPAGLRWDRLPEPVG